MVFTSESFHIGGAPAGAISREATAHFLRTVTCFQVPGGPLVHNESLIEFDQDVFGWSFYSYVERGTGLRAHVARERRHATGCLPGYAEWLVIHGMLRAGLSRLHFSTLEDSDACASPLAAELSVRPGVAVLDKAGKALRTTGEIVLSRGGKVRNRHWVSGTEVVASDWNGARSYAEPTLAAALAGVSAEVAAILRGEAVASQIPG